MYVLGVPRRTVVLTVVLLCMLLCRLPTQLQATQLTSWLYSGSACMRQAHYFRYAVHESCAASQLATELGGTPCHLARLHVHLIVPLM